MKFKGFIFFIILVLLFLTSCTDVNLSDDKSVLYGKESSEEERQMDYLTADEFWEKTGLNKDDYTGVDIDQFIQDYQIDEVAILYQ